MNKDNVQRLGTVAVLMGGLSAEREISLKSGQAILAALKKKGVNAIGVDIQKDAIHQLLSIKPDRAFVALHGPMGEDGVIQGLLEYLDIPYTGSDVNSSAVAMNKVHSKLIWEALDIPTLRFRVVLDEETAIEVMQDFGLPLCVKPCTNGSSMGVSKVVDPQQLPDAFRKAAAHDPKVMIEPWIEGPEYTVGILGNQPLPVIEIQTPCTFYDFEAKYNLDSTAYLAPTGLKPEHLESLQALSWRAFQALGCRDWGRVDLMMDTEGNPWLLEVNTIPGMTDHSLVPKAAAKIGLSFEDLVLEILTYTLDRQPLVTA